ncbi:MAG: hypothetical protein OXL97_12950 [Chloroflexota bacterium]|nr:hypothetical protein [Chloroflexota bacterium]MDE2883771.1 hypothetical protein [Chloroflexota bacterium]
MNAPGPDPQPLTPAAELLGEALRVYARNALMLIAVAAAGALAGNLIGLLVSPVTDARFDLVDLVIVVLFAGLAFGLLAPVWLLAMLALRQEPLTAVAVLYGFVTLSPRFFTLGLLLGTGVGALVLLSVYVELLSLPALAVLIFLGVRLSLVGPVIAQEGGTPLRALVRSWRLVEGHWWRTFVIQLPVGVFAFILSEFAGRVAGGADATIVVILVSAATLGVSAPLIALVETALYQEYSGQRPPAVEAGPPG